MSIQLIRLDAPGSITVTTSDRASMESLVGFLAGLVGSWRMLPIEPDYDAQAEIADGYNMLAIGQRTY